MNWQVLLQTVLQVFEENPGLAKSLLTILLNLFVSNPKMLEDAINLGLAQAKKT